MTSPSFRDELRSGAEATLSYLDPDLGAEVSLPYTIWEPRNPGAPFILYTHGLQSHREWSYGLGETLAAAGYGFVVYDRPASGESRGYPRGHVTHFRSFLLAQKKFRQLLRVRFPESPIVLWGNSFGAKVLVADLLDDPSEKSPVILTAPGLYIDSKRMPLPFSRLRFLVSASTTVFPSVIPAVDGDQGAGLFTTHAPYFDKIRNDTRSLRSYSKSYYLQIRALDRFIEKNSGRFPALLDSLPGICILVKSDPMMDNGRLRRFLADRAPSWRVFELDRDPEHGHFVLFTPARVDALREIYRFLEGLA